MLAFWCYKQNICIRNQRDLNMPHPRFFCNLHNSKEGQNVQSKCTLKQLSSRAIKILCFECMLDTQASPPIGKGMTPVAGQVVWARSLFARCRLTMQRVLQLRPDLTSQPLGLQVMVLGFLTKTPILCCNCFLFTWSLASGYGMAASGAFFSTLKMLKDHNRSSSSIIKA